MLIGQLVCDNPPDVWWHTEVQMDNGKQVEVQVFAKTVEESASILLASEGAIKELVTTDKTAMQAAVRTEQFGMLLVNFRSDSEKHIKKPHIIIRKHPQKN